MRFLAATGQLHATGAGLGLSAREPGRPLLTCGMGAAITVTGPALT